MLRAEVLAAQAATLDEWAARYEQEASVAGATELAFRLRRAAKLARAIANDEPLVDEPEPAKEPDLDSAPAD